ncbi:CDP-alcohol phosphatidyltransferase family protein [Thermodesulfobacteriota bacterium]
MNIGHRHFPSLVDIRKAHGWKRDYEKYLPISRFIFRPIGFLLTWVALRIGLTTESTAWLSGIVGVSGCVFIMSKHTNFILFGIFLLLFFNLLDCVDGSIARVTKTENPYGRFLDSICGGIVDLAFWGVVGVMAFRNEDLLIWPDPCGVNTLFWLAIGSLTCFLYIFTSFIEKIFKSTLRHHWDQIRTKYRNKLISPRENYQRPLIEDPDSKARCIVRMLNTNLRVRESHYLLLIISYFTGSIDLLLSIFFIYYLCQVIILLAIFSQRGKAVRVSHLEDTI